MKLQTLIKNIKRHSSKVSSKANNLLHQTSNQTSNTIKSTMVNNSNNNMTSSKSHEEAGSQHRRASTEIKHFWTGFKEMMKETHQGLNQAYEVYYGPFRVPQENERRMS